MIPHDVLRARILDFLERELHLERGQIEPHTALLTTGLVDSIALVRLAALIERLTGLRIPDRDVTAEHFDTLDRMRAYLERARGS